jgi:hypothetical protein
MEFCMTLSKRRFEEDWGQSIDGAAGGQRAELSEYVALRLSIRHSSESRNSAEW